MCSLISPGRVLKLPDSLDPYLIMLDEPVRLPVCRACQAALLPKSLMDHLRKHHQLPQELRKTVRFFLSLISTLPPLDFDDVPCNPDGSAPVEVLRVVDAFQCNHCPFIRRDVTDVRKHINQEHGISAASSYDEIKAQSWFGGRRAVYWRVCDGSTAEKSECLPAEETSKETNLSLEPPTDTLALCQWGFFGKGFGNRLPKSWSGVDTTRPWEV